MAQIITFPGTVNFQRNPIVVSFASTNVNRTFQSAVMEATLRTKAENGWLTLVNEERYSIPLDYAGNTPVKFDLKTLASVAKPGYTTSPLDSTGIIARDSILLNIKLYEEYLYNGEILYDPPLNSSFPTHTHTAQLNVLPGGLTDYERMSLDKPLAELIGSTCILSRKPEGEILHPQGYYIIPAVTNLPDATTVWLMLNENTPYGNDSRQLDSYRCFVYRRRIADVLAEHPTAQTLRAYVGDNAGPLAYIARKPVKPYHFHFVNGFGMMESITCYARDRKTVELQTSENVFVPERDFKSVMSVFTTKSDVTESYLLSTGVVNRQWAEWFTTEFFTTSEAYMEVDGNWIPVSIIPDDKITVYDRQKPEPISMEFTARPQFNGPLNNRFVKR